MVESTSESNQHFRIKSAPITKAGAPPATYIDEIACDFSENQPEWGDVVCAKFDPYDKYVAASYSKGGLRVLNSFNGKMTHTLIKTSSTEASEGATAVVNCLRFKPNTSSEKDLLIAVNSEGKLQYWSLTAGMCVRTVE
jgi:WD40 repeat protein